MAGGNRDHFCTACNRSVYDLSILTRRQSADLLAKNAGKICGRISYDERGNAVFAKDRSPIGRLMQISLLGASAIASAATAPTCEGNVRVVDPSGAVVPQAVVKIASGAGAGAVSSGTSNDRERGLAAELLQGTYSLQVESPGFMPFQYELTCKKSETISIDAPLRIGLMGEVIEVKSKAFWKISAPSFAVYLTELSRLAW